MLRWLACFWMVMAGVAHAQVFLVDDDPGTPRVAVFPFGAHGDVAPLRSIQGPLTQLQAPSSIAVDAVHGEIFVADYLAKAIFVYPLDANGDVPPLRVLTDGPASGLGSPRRVRVDPVSSEIVVTGGTMAVRTYSRTAAGDTAPVRVLEGPSTRILGGVVQVALVGTDLLVSTNDVSADPGGQAGILTFPRSANGDVAPSRVLSGPSTLLDGGSLAYDPQSDEVYSSLGASMHGVVVFPRSASGDSPPIRSLIGPDTTFSSVDLVTGLGYHGGSIYLGRLNYDVSALYPTGYVSFPRLADGNVPPATDVAGALAGLRRVRDFDFVAVSAVVPSPVPMLSPALLALLAGLLILAGIPARRKV